MLLSRLENGNVFLYKSQKQGMLHLFGTNRANCCSSRVATESNPLNVSGNRYFPFTWEQNLFIFPSFRKAQMIFFDLLMIASQIHIAQNG